MTNAQFNKWFREPFNVEFGISFDRWILPFAERIATLEAEVKTLRQRHCDHDFSNKAKGCLASLFCSKCGALHPDWEQVDGAGWHMAHRHAAVWLDGCGYAKKAKKSTKKGAK